MITMKRMVVSSLPVSEVISDLAQHFGTELTKECRFHRIDLPLDFGKGFIDGIDFGYGFGMLNYDCTFLEDIEIHFTYNHVHPLKFLHCYQGDLVHRFDHMDRVNKVDTYGNLIVASEQHHGHILRFEANKRVRICSIEVDRKEFSPYYDCEMQHADMREHRLKKVLDDRSAVERFCHQGNYSIAVSEIINDIINFDRNPFLKNQYIHGKCQEMLCRVWMQYEDDASGKHTIHRQVQVLRYDEVMDYASSNLQNDLTVKALSQKFELSVAQLQDVFKVFSGKTVNATIQELRLAEAVRLMEETNLNMSEIVDAIGLKSRSYFSRIFLEAYEMKPSAYAKKARKAEK